MSEKAPTPREHAIDLRAGGIMIAILSIFFCVLDLFVWHTKMVWIICAVGFVAGLVLITLGIIKGLRAGSS